MPRRGGPSDSLAALFVDDPRHDPCPEVAPDDQPERLMLQQGQRHHPPLLQHTRQTQHRKRCNGERRHDEFDGVAEEAAAFMQSRRTLPDGTLEFGADGTRTEIICGHFELAARSTHPLLASLPDVVFLRRGEGDDAAWAATATRLAAAEAASGRPGSEAMVDRLAEALMIQVIRAQGNQLGAELGFLAALSDPTVSPALREVHAEPAHPWTVDGLAQVGGASRPVFAARFKELLGRSPMQYVTQWRRHRARAWLRDERLSLAEVGCRAGYASEFAFAKAFKRVFGVAPGAYRRSSGRR